VRHQKFKQIKAKWFKKGDLVTTRRHIIMIKHGNKKAQTWSVDLVLGVVIFLLVIVIIYSLIASRPGKESQLRDDADRIYVSLAGDKASAENINMGDVPTIIEGNAISREQLAELYQQDYQTLKEKFGITSDFCILVVTDDNALIMIGENTSIGNGEDVLIGSSIYCGEKI
jgi:hypothetical protein